MSDVPEGYKMSEVGVIPKEWEVLNVSDFTIDEKGSIKIGPFGSQLKKETLVNQGYKVYGQENIYKKNMELGDRFISTEHFNKLKSCELHSGDFVISMMGTIGKCMVVPNNIQKGIMDSHLLRLQLEKDKVNPIYLSQLFISSIIFNQIKQLSVGGIMDGLSSSIIQQINFSLPPLPEQQAISSALNDVDALITALEQLITKKRNIKQGAMQQLLTGKKHLPGYDGEWKDINMAKKSVLKARIGWQGLTTDEYLKNGEYYLVTGTDFIDGKINWSGCHFVDKNRYVQDKNIQLKNSDVLITKDGTIGKVGYIDKLPRNATLNSGVFVIRPRDKSYHPLFFYYVLKSCIFNNFIKQLQAGSTISHLYQKDFVNFSFSAPPHPEQQAIAQILTDMDTEIESLKQKRNKYKAIKQGMMQELLTGKTRLL